MYGIDGSGWVTGQVNGASGLIPLSYIEMEQFYEAPTEPAPIQKGIRFQTWSFHTSIAIQERTENSNDEICFSF